MVSLQIWLSFECLERKVTWLSPIFFESILKSSVSVWLIWTKKQHDFNEFSGMYWIKNKELELARELCKTSGKGGVNREESSEANNW